MRTDIIAYLRENRFFLVFAALILVLPIAHTASIRSSLHIIILALWGVFLWQGRKSNLRRTPLDLPLLLFFCAIIASIFTSIAPLYSLKEFRGEFLTYVFLFYAAVFNTRDEDEVRRLVNVLLMGSFIMAAYGIFDFLRHSEDVFDIGYRAGSLHQGYEAYAQYIVMVIPFNLAALIDSRSAPARAALAGLLILNSLALFFTFTRGAWLAYFVEIMLFSFMMFRNWWYKVGVVAAVAVAIAAALSLLPERTVWHGEKGFGLAAETIENTGSERLTEWNGFYARFSEAPFTAAGYGKANYKRMYQRADGTGFEQAHNTFINTAAQLGLQGLLALLLVIAVLLRVGWKTFRNGASQWQRCFGAAFFTMTIGFFIANQFAEFYIDDTAQLFWLLAGLCVFFCAPRRPLAQ